MSFGGQFFSGVLNPEIYGNWIQPIIGVFNMLPVIPAYFMLQKYGRKSILWSCTLGIAIALVCCGVAQILTANSIDKSAGGIASLSFLIIYIILFELSQGPVTWVYCTEIMTEQGLTLALSVNQLLTFLTQLLAPVL